MGELTDIFGHRKLIVEQLIKRDAIQVSLPKLIIAL
jgi:hypothetical protein